MSAFDRLHAQLGTLHATQVFFIGGSPKSGTTWLQLMLDAHPLIACKGESHVIDHLAPLLFTILDKHNQMIDQKNRRVFAESSGFPLYNADDLTYLIGASLLLAFTKRNDDRSLRALGEKTPDNVRSFPSLHGVFPGARFLHVVRDGRDCAVSGWFHNLRTNGDWIRAKYSSLAAYAEMFAREWATDIDAAQRFSAAFPRAYFTVRYESLLQDPAGTLRAVLAFLDIASEDETVARCVATASFEQLSGGRPRGEEDRQSFFRSGTQGNWRQHLTEADDRAFIAAADPWMQRLGYV